MTDTINSMEDNSSDNHEPVLTQQQARIFACLIEKHLSTPKSYPLTIHSLMLACNQKSNRHPVMSLSEGQVQHIANELVDIGLARIEYGQRANKVMHRKGELNINREEAAVLCMLMLREPLTMNQIKARTDKMVAFENIEAVENIVTELQTRQKPLIVMTAKSSGRREDRYTHTLCGEVIMDSETAKAPNKSDRSTSQSTGHDPLKRIEALEARLEKVESLLNELIG